MYVSDTHPLLWYLTGKHSLLPTKIVAAFDQANEGSSLIKIPSVALWEVAILEKKGRVKLGHSFDHWAAKLSSNSGFDIIPLENQIISLSVGYTFNNDIFDKAIVATAVHLDLPLITKDFAITESKLAEVYW